MDNLWKPFSPYFLFYRLAANLPFTDQMELIIVFSCKDNNTNRILYLTLFYDFNPRQKSIKKPSKSLNLKGLS